MNKTVNDSFSKMLRVETPKQRKKEIMTVKNEVCKTSKQQFRDVNLTTEELLN